jgi:predicted DNA-binding transcriptional regulator AlpA
MECRVSPLEQPEPFVDSSAVAAFLCLERRQVLEMARRGAIPAYSASLGSRRRMWRFRLSEIADAMSKRLKKPVGLIDDDVDNRSRQSRSGRKGNT